MSRRRVAAALVILALGLVAGTPRAGAAGRPRKNELNVYAAASLVDVFDELGRALERRRPGLVVRMNYAGSQQLAAQIEQGGRADVFASADAGWMKHVKDRGLVAGEPAVFARNRMVVIVPATNPARIARLQDLARGGVKLVLCAEAVPAGHYARDMIRNLGRDPVFGAAFAGRALRNVVSEEENVRAVVAKVQLGEADAGIVYHSDVGAKLLRYVRMFEVPAAASVLAEYPIAALGSGRDADAARAFVELVLSPEGQRALERHGFIVGADGGR